MKKCFVISPIGEEGSEIREQADDLFDLVIKRALEKFDFEVVRADKIPRPSVITADIIQLVQTSELCIIDLTTHNPNVFYEVGRRHETGLPFVQMIRRGETLPFDLASIRTIEYDLTSPRAVDDAISMVQSFVEEFASEDYEIASSGESLATIAASLNRIEQKLQNLRLAGTGAGPPGPAGHGVDVGDPLSAYTNPRQAFLEAVAAGDIASMVRLLPRLERLLGPTEEVALAASMVARAGEQAGADALIRLVDAEESFDNETAATVVSALVQYFSLTDREEEGMELIEQLVEPRLSRGGLNDEEEAFFLNQKQKLLYGAGDYEKALNSCLRVVELQPSDPTYLYNLSLIQEALGMMDACLESVDRYMALETDQASHLRQAVEVYVRQGRIDEAHRTLSRLSELHPRSAALVLMDDSIRKALDR